ncbi:hypothetical protein [uncultured Sulfitobacter sp.]
MGASSMSLVRDARATAAELSIVTAAGLPVVTGFYPVGACTENPMVIFG